MIETRKLKVPLYGGTFTILLYDSEEELQESIKPKEFDVKGFDGGVFTIEGVDYISFHYYFNEEYKVQYPTPGIIAHESKHLVNNIFIDIHHKLDRYNDEPEAYLLGWIVNRIHEFINQIKK